MQPRNEALNARLKQMRAALKAIGQAHVLAFADDLPAPDLIALLDQIDLLKIDRLAAWAREAVLSHSVATEAIEPAQYCELHQRSVHLKSVGEAVLRAGKLAAFVVAGGQGTRLGFDGPKGMFGASPIRKKSLFELFAEQILATEQRYGVVIPWYVMTSPLNHAQTTDFFQAHRFFGLREENVFFFSQGVLPSYDFEGRLLLAERGRVATHPDGHGGSLKALVESGAIADMRRRGIEQISYFQVDNPMVKILDPLFVGLHVASPESSGELSAKILRKRAPEEPVGVFVTEGGRTRIIEYSNFDHDLRMLRDASGRLMYDAGSPAIHLFSVEFVERLMARGDFRLPLNRARKIVPYIDLQTGEHVTPAKPNAIKLETFVFDALPLARSVALLEIDRAEEFAPIKNSEGEDSPQTCIALQSERAARRLEALGIACPRKPGGALDVVLEMTAAVQMQLEDFKAVLERQIFEPSARYLLRMEGDQLRVERHL